MKSLYTPLSEYSVFEDLLNDIKYNKFPIALFGTENTNRYYLMKGIGQQARSQLKGKKQPKLIITYHEERAKEICSAYRFFDKEVYHYPAKDILFYSADIHGNVIQRQRIEIIKRMMDAEEMTIVVSIDALLDKLPPLAELEKSRYFIQCGQELNLAELKEALISLGYEPNDWVDGVGEFSIRGGIIDIFPLASECPFRIELWGDVIDSIRSFDIESQRSIEQIQDLMIYPASEIVLTKERLDEGMNKIDTEHKAHAKKLKESFQTEEYARINREVARLKEELEYLHGTIGIDSYIEYFYNEVVSFLDYFDKECLIFVDEPVRVIERMEACRIEFSESMSGRLEGGYILPTQANVLFDFEHLLGKISNRKTILFSTFQQTIPLLEPKISYDIETKIVSTYHNNFEMLIKDLKQWKRDKYKIIFLSPSATRGKRLCEDFRDHEIECFYTQDINRELSAGEMMITTGRLKTGFAFTDMKLVVISESDIFTEQKKKRKMKRKPLYTGEKINGFDDISVGDYVVHERHGLGIYLGIEKIEVDKTIKDYISIEYKGGSKLFILASQLDLIQKYSSKEGRRPKLNKLGGSEWEKTKSKVRGKVKETAKELVELYAVRQSREGYAYSADTVWQKEFEELFPYEETDDQLKSIAETKADMESQKIMDRLICGDVGYGKTEVAIRAAFKAVTDGKQVVYLVPTTILAQQHYNSFLERMGNFPIQIRMLSRFLTAKEQRETITGLRKGEIDIVIGTHRLLSKDLEYKNLGLLIIDEEQRFGVSHKEKIKLLKKDIDVLTLTATPIPRTLHMSLIGIRDMSLLEEPPIDRKPIQTYVLEFNEELVKEAIRRELARNGQVYYVYNRVNTIDEMTYRLKELLPEARISFAHGQMHEKELEEVMYRFINKEIDVLVTTTIIETGLDIANVNTMLIHDAENFGLSQLYQLRGRVGRSNKTAYAFLMYKRDKMLKETAEKRLKAIREFTDLGSGFKIAMRDLEIRGAGNLLGADQSGHMEAVGYDLYCKMLNDAIKKQRGETVADDFSTNIELPLDAFIPPNYVKNEMMKLELYKRIAGIESEEDYEDMLDEITDRFGHPPIAVLQLLQIARMKAFAHQAGIEQISWKNGILAIVIYKGTDVCVEKIDTILKKYQNTMRLVQGKNAGFEVTAEQIDKKDLITYVQGIIEDIRLITSNASRKTN